MKEAAGAAAGYNGTTSTPKNHQQRRVDVSLQLLEALRAWRRAVDRLDTLTVLERDQALA